MNYDQAEAAVNYTFDDAPQKLGREGDILTDPKQIRYRNMSQLRQLLQQRDPERIQGITRLKDQGVIRTDINFDKIPNGLFKTNLEEVFPAAGGRRRKSRKTRRRRHHRKTRRSRK
jgi:hypothetical protein